MEALHLSHTVASSRRQLARCESLFISVVSLSLSLSLSLCVCVWPCLRALRSGKCKKKKRRTDNEHSIGKINAFMCSHC